MLGAWSHTGHSDAVGARKSDWQWEYWGYWDLPSSLAQPSQAGVLVCQLIFTWVRMIPLARPSDIMGCRRVLRRAMGCFGVLDAQAGLSQAGPAQTQPCRPVGISPASNHGVELEIRHDCKTGPSLVPESCNAMASLNNTQTLTEARVCHL